jgi:Pre-toxin TG
MSFSKQLMQYGQRRATKKLYRVAPWIGGLVALATLGATIRRKGPVRGTLDTVLDFIPFVGGVKNIAEVVRGRDLIADRPTPPNLRPLPPV